jgi:hypothetical protein
MVETKRNGEVEINTVAENDTRHELTCGVSDNLLHSPSQKL